MNKKEALQFIASNGYNVGYGAKKHFATYDIVEKVPGLIGFLSIAFGLLSLKYFTEELEGHVAIFLTLFGVVSLYISMYASEKDKYRDAGNCMTKHFSQLHKSYLTVKSDDLTIEAELEKVNATMDDFYGASIEKQILFSDWYAHYKFFVQMQIDWINNEKKFGFFKDKIPRSAQLLALLLLGIAIFSYRFLWLGWIGQFI